MKNLFISTVLILLSAISLFSQTCDWAEKIAGDSSANVQSVKVDGNGNIYVIGYFTSTTLNFNNGKSLGKSGGNDGFLAEYNSEGICQWAEKIAGTGDDYVYDVSIGENGNIYVIGYFTSTALNFNNGKSLENSGGNDDFIAEYNSEGICQWTEKIAGTGDDYARSVKADGNGNVYVSGSFSSSELNFNNGKSLINIGNRDGYIAKFNSSGICQWAEKIAGTAYDGVNSVTVDANGNVYVGGSYSSTVLTFNNSITLGDTESGYGYAFIAKYNSSGICQWAEQIPGPGTSARKVTVDANGNLYVNGEFLAEKITFNNGKSLKKSGSYDGYFAKFNSSGICQWAVQIAGTEEDFTEFVETDVNGNLYIVGEFFSSQLTFNNGKSLSNSGHWDGFIAEYDSDGICQWAEKIAGTSTDGVNCARVDANNNLIVVGEFFSPQLTFNNGISLTKSGSLSGFIAKYSLSKTSIPNEPIQNKFSVYPNPATDYIEIQPSEGWQPSEGSYIQILNTLGEIVLSVEQTPPSVQKIDISNLTSGMYFIKIGDKVEKFVKM
jgi:hypothetical protein